MRIVPFRIPEQVVLPGLVVQVRQVPAAKLEGATALWIYNEEDRAAIILIRKSLPMTVKRYTLLHELQHVLVDYLDQAIENHSRHFKTKTAAGGG